MEMTDFPEFRQGEHDSRIGVVQRFLLRYGYLEDSFVLDRLDQNTARALITYKRVNRLPVRGADFNRDVAMKMSERRCERRDDNMISGRRVTRCSWPKDKKELLYEIVNPPELGNLSQQEVIDEPLQGAFEVWVKQGKLPISTFRRASGSEAADVKIEWIDAIGNRLEDDNIAYADFPPCPNEMPQARSMLFNRGVSWLYGNGIFYDLQAVAMHEIGHLIGLDHSPNSKVMNPSFSAGSHPERHGLVQEDIDFVFSLYLKARISVFFGQIAERFMGLFRR